MLRLLATPSENEALTMARNGSDLLIEGLIEWGVDTIFGMPGDGINGVMEAIRTHSDKVRFVQVRHEESAALMACGYAKWTGKLGCCLATTGPGGIHLLNGLYDAKFDRAPVRPALSSGGGARGRRAADVAAPQLASIAASGSLVSRTRASEQASVGAAAK
jgi:glyoxylate carboligase